MFRWFLCAEKGGLLFFRVSWFQTKISMLRVKKDGKWIAQIKDGAKYVHESWFAEMRNLGMFL
jgi:hypothetical protein